MDINRLYGCSQDDFYKANFVGGDNEEFKWALGCDFIGNDYRYVEKITAEECAWLCVAHSSNCTHFAHLSQQDRNCYLKKALGAPETLIFSPLQGAVCGFINRRDSLGGGL